MNFYISMEKKITTMKEFIKHCFYTFEGEVHWNFNEMWEPKYDNNISEEFLKKLKRMARKL